MVKRLQCRRPGFDPWVGKIPWRRESLCTPVFWPGEFHGLYSPWDRKESDMNEWLSLSLCSFSPIYHGLLNGISLTQPHHCIGQRHGRGWLKSNKSPLSLSLSLNHLCYYLFSYCFLLSSSLLCSTLLVKRRVLTCLKTSTHLSPAYHHFFLMAFFKLQ